MLTLLDFLAVAALIILALVTEKGNFQPNTITADYFLGAGNAAYDPYLWLVIVPLDFVSFLVNVWLLCAMIRRHFRTPLSRLSESKLEKVLIRDNLIYLSAYVYNQSLTKIRPC